jgi:archaellum biogenesis ATPase FlaH
MTMEVVILIYSTIERSRMTIQAVIGLLTLVSSLLCAIVSLSNRGIKGRLSVFEKDVRKSLESQDGKLDRLTESFAAIDKRIAVSDSVISFLRKEVEEIKQHCREVHHGKKV